MAPKIKICGLMDGKTLSYVRELPVDYAGFIFASSRRRVQPEQVRAWLEEAELQETGRLRAVGVFVNPSREQLTATVKTAGLAVVQLHGGESPDECRWVKESLGVDVIKVLSVAGASQGQAAERDLTPYAGVIDGVLLDTYDPVVGGGTGKAFAWSCIPAYQVVARGMNAPLLVAGGLHADNVAELLETYRPDGVDVSSGVETDGIKDLDKIKAFVERVSTIGSGTGS